MLRRPAVAGQFYSEKPEILKNELGRYLEGGAHDRAATGIIVPHAGYVFSGSIAAEAYKAVEIPRTVLLLGPDHHGLSGPATAFASGSWQTPLGEVPIAEDLASRLLADCDLLEADESAQRFEHSIEVQIPFLQMLRADLRILPISLGHASLDSWLRLGRQLGQSLRQWHERVLLVASSDMNHFESAVHTERVDRLAIEQMENFDPTGLYKLVRERNISMCGVIPATVMLEAASVLGATSCQLLCHAHSGMVNRDMQSVVGYASLIID
jgi:AmmeMemoRadiSam system protein B